MGQHRKQHFIPACYLRAWLDPELPLDQTPYVWRFEKDSREGKKKSPEKIFRETDMYTITGGDGVRDLVLEHGLAELENAFTDIRRRILDRGNAMSHDEHFTLCTFVAAMHARTPTSREHQRTQWGQALKIMDDMVERMRDVLPEQRKSFSRVASGNGPSLTHDQVRQMVEQPLQSLLATSIHSEAPLLRALDFAILETKDEIGFITSDHPCVWFDPEGYKRPPMHQGPALMYKSIEISFPISPRQCLLLNRKGLIGYVSCPIEAVDSINSRTRHWAAEHFVVRKNVTKERWFDTGVEPPDSWSRTHLDQESEC